MPPYYERVTACSMRSPGRTLSTPRTPVGRRQASPTALQHKGNYQDGSGGWMQRLRDLRGLTKRHVSHICTDSNEAVGQSHKACQASRTDTQCHSDNLYTPLCGPMAHRQHTCSRPQTDGTSSNVHTPHEDILTNGSKAVWIAAAHNMQVAAQPCTKQQPMRYEAQSPLL
jgi:hypothetical protein